MSDTRDDFKVTFNGKELNYLERALNNDINALMDFGKMGNVSQLVWFQKRLYRKIQELRRPKRFCTRWNRKWGKVKPGAAK